MYNSKEQEMREEARAAIIEALEDGYSGYYCDLHHLEIAAFKKRLNTYLKRYGLSKIHTWSYWRDA